MAFTHLYVYITVFRYRSALYAHLYDVFISVPACEVNNDSDSEAYTRGCIYPRAVPGGEAPSPDILGDPRQEEVGYPASIYLSNTQ